MRKHLDRLYQLSGGLAAFFLLAIALIVLAQVSLNIADSVYKLFYGAPIGLVLPSYADFAGFFLAASSFFALAYTLNKGAHIRVTLLISRLSGHKRAVIELWCCFFGFCFSAYFSYYITLLVIESWHYNDRSTGMVSIPSWIPQLPLALGALILTIAFADHYLSILKGKTPGYEDSVAAEPGE